ncbi:MAG: N-formylglutamate amidohydrolase [Pseudomonadota bacterium]|nr:N-formylglutamate amidohydrolase [Pseudomonadota bacterium]
MKTSLNSSTHDPVKTASAARRNLAKVTGGKVPGGLGEMDAGHAFTHVAPVSQPMPLVIAVPHAGRAYPASVLADMRDEEISQLRLEDRFVDQLGVAVAKDTGAGLLVAHAPRAMLDLNRAHDDVDWDMIAGAKRGDPNPQPVAQSHSGGTNRRARSGLGLVPRRLPGFGEVWRKPLLREQLDLRIDHIHRPYHEFLEQELRRIRDRWGAVLLVDLHSMPPLRARAGHEPAAKIVLGDRFGASCHADLLSRAFRRLEDAGLPVSHNRPYSGGYVLDRHASPTRGIHALQVEVCRSTYLDAGHSETTSGLTKMADILQAVVRELGAETARLGGRNRLKEAAE